MTTYSTAGLTRLAELDEIEGLMEECYGLQDIAGHEILDDRQLEAVRSLTVLPLTRLRQWRKRWDEQAPSDAGGDRG